MEGTAADGPLHGAPDLRLGAGPGTSWALGPEGREAAIAVGYGADGKLLLLWPFETARICGLTVLSWLGQDVALLLASPASSEAS